MTGLAAALQHHQAGRLSEAEAIYRGVLAQEPANVDALHLLGVLARQSRQPGQAEELIRRAIGLNSAVGNNLTGNDSIRFICRVYNRPFKLVRDYVDDFAQLGTALSEPVRTYSAGMQGRLNFALSFAVDFDCYLIDEVIAAGDARFQRRCHEELFEKRSDRSLILTSHIPDIVRSYCSRALVLHRGRGKMFEDLELAIAIYNDL